MPSAGNYDGLRLLAKEFSENWGIPFRSCPAVGICFTALILGELVSQVCTSSSHSFSICCRGRWGGHTLWSVCLTSIVLVRVITPLKCDGFVSPLAERSSLLPARTPVNPIQSHPRSHTVSSAPAVDRTDHEHTVFRHGCAINNARMVFHARTCAKDIWVLWLRWSSRIISARNKRRIEAGLQWPYLYFVGRSSYGASTRLGPFPNEQPSRLHSSLATTIL